MNRPVFSDPSSIQALRTRIREEFDTATDSREPDWSSEIARVTQNSQEPRKAAKELEAYLARVWYLKQNLRDDVSKLIIQYYADWNGARNYFQANSHEKGLRICELIRILTKLALQGETVFPLPVTVLAERFWNVAAALINSYHPMCLDQELAVILDLFTAPPVNDTVNVCTGMNFLEVSDPNEVIFSGYRDEQYSFQEVVKNPQKIVEFTKDVEQNAEFKKDWERLKKDFAVRSLASRDGSVWRPSARRSGECHPGFSVAFECFCWKWFLAGMKGDTPIVQAVEYRFTPYGTEILIPGYVSIDFARDILWKRISKLHKARGTRTQGVKRTEDRRSKKARWERMLAADIYAKNRGIRGEERIELIKDQGRFPPTPRDIEKSSILRMLRNARRTGIQPDPNVLKELMKRPHDPAEKHPRSTPRRKTPGSE